MRAMEAHTSAWLAGLPATLQPLRRTVENIKDPLYRCRLSFTYWMFRTL